MHRRREEEQGAALPRARPWSRSVCWREAPEWCRGAPGGQRECGREREDDSEAALGRPTRSPHPPPPLRTARSGARARPGWRRITQGPSSTRSSRSSPGRLTLVRPPSPPPRCHLPPLNPLTHPPAPMQPKRPSSPTARPSRTSPGPPSARPASSSSQVRPPPRPRRPPPPRSGPASSPSPTFLDPPCSSTRWQVQAAQGQAERQRQLLDRQDVVSRRPAARRGRQGASSTPSLRFPPLHSLILTLHLPYSVSSRAACRSVAHSPSRSRAARA